MQSVHVQIITWDDARSRDGQWVRDDAVVKTKRAAMALR